MLDEDLLARYERELGDVKGAWEKGHGALTPAVAKKERQAVNAFFHQEIQALNAPTLAALDKAPKTTADHRKAADAALARVAANPVAKLESIQSYDQGGQVGYCFGRALLVHLFLRQAGVPQADIAKIFTVGELMVERQLWRFHVAVMVRDAAAGYLVVDPLQGKVLPYGEWVQANALYDIKGKLSRARFYVTDPRKFLPSFGAYDVKRFDEPALKRYFDDLGKSLL